MSLFRRLYNVARSNLGSRGSADPGLGSAEADSIRGSSAQHEGGHPEPPPDPKSTQAAEYYANLELSPGASLEEIKAAHRRLLRMYHPDRHHSSRSRAKAAEEISKRLNAAMDYFQKEHQRGRL